MVNLQITISNLFYLFMKVVELRNRQEIEQIDVY